MSNKITKIVAALAAVTLTLSACGNSADQEELERLRKENEELKAQQTAETTIVETTTTTTESEEDNSEMQDTEWTEYDDCYVRFDGATTVPDYNGDIALVVQMTFRNNSEEPHSCGYTFDIDAYQDGVECDLAILSGDVDEEFDTSTYLTDIQPGIEFTVFRAYKLRSDSSDVVIDVRGFYDFDNKLLYEQTYYFGN